MLNTIKTKAISAKDHVKNNKVAYASTAVAFAAIALQQRNRIAFTEFLEEKGLDPMEFYCPEYFAELQVA